MNRINNDKKIRPILYQHPFPPEDIRIMIMSHLSNEEKGIYLEAFGICHNELDYYKAGPKKIGPPVCVLNETYEEALEAVKISMQNKLNSIDAK